jgi:hypothetical protein
MPGIVAIISRNKPPGECQRLVQAMLASMKHERFYESSTCSVLEAGVTFAFAEECFPGKS